MMVGKNKKVKQSPDTFGEEVVNTLGYDTIIDEKYRVYASISFAVLILGIGIPLWWHTTAVPRASLPYDGIEQLSDLEIIVKTKLVVAVLSQDRAESLARDIKDAFKNDTIYRIQIVQHTISSNLVAAAFTHHELEKVATTFDLGVGELLLLETNNLNDAVLVGSKRTIFFSVETSEEFNFSSTDEFVLSEWMLHEKSLTLTRNALTDPTLYSLDEENRRRFPASPVYDVSITLINPDPEKLKIDWDLRTMTEEYVDPFLDELSIVSNFSVKTQWLYLLPLYANPKRVPDSGPFGRHFALPEDVLPQLITPLEKKLGILRTLVFIQRLILSFMPFTVTMLRYIFTHVLANDQKPTPTLKHFYLRGNPRFLPRLRGASETWGGVVLINPPVEACTSTETDKPITIAPEQATVVGTFLAQLKLLLGIPDTKFLNGVSTVPSVGLKLRNWEIDALLRIRTIEQLTSAKLTLQSLARLLQQIRNIGITDVVGNRIKDALRLVEHSAQRLAFGDLEQAFLLSKEAFVSAEAAFSDPTLSAFLYFPEDQKYAVYTPLFLPGVVPVLLSLKNIYRYYTCRKVISREKGQSQL